MLKIEDFHALLTSDSEENALLVALRKFMGEDSKRFFNALIKAEAIGWLSSES